MESAGEKQASMRFFGQMSNITVSPLKVLVFATDQLRLIMQVSDSSMQNILSYP